MAAAGEARKAKRGFRELADDPLAYEHSPLGPFVPFAPSKGTQGTPCFQGPDRQGRYHLLQIDCGIVALIIIVETYGDNDEECEAYPDNDSRRAA